MAYAFDGSSQFLLCNTPPVTGVPFTIAAWFYQTTATTAVIASLVHDTTSERHNLATVATSGSLAVAASTNSNALASSSTTTTVAPNTWAHGVGVWRSTAYRQVWLNGEAATANTSSINAPTVQRFRIGARATQSTSLFFPGNLAEVGVWSAELTAAEIASLASGVSPELIRPQSLVFYAPLIRDLVDVRGGLAITNTASATVATHPRVYA